MSNRNNEHMVFERLRSENDMELMQLEITRYLDEELSKPAEEMDVQLIDELMDMLGIASPSPEQLERSRLKIHEQAHARKCCWVQVLTRLAAAFIALVVVFFVSFETAKAFRWTHLLKVLTPVAETFGIYSASSIDSQAPAPQRSISFDADTEYTQQTYLSIEEMPAEVDGFKLVPEWIPDRFSFMQGAVYLDPDMAEASVTYQAGEDTVIIRWMLSYSDEDTFSYEYERKLDVPTTEIINGLELSYYENIDNNRIYASWVDRDAHYQVAGNITIEEAKLIAESLMK